MGDSEVCDNPFTPRMVCHDVKDPLKVKYLSSPSAMEPKEEHASTESLHSDSNWTRHLDLYMEDGSVVLLAENTVFRVYLKWLGKKSDVFAQLASFDDVQPPDSEMYDGCPLIRLSDTAEDLEHFLAAMDGCGRWVASFHIREHFLFYFISGISLLIGQRLSKLSRVSSAWQASTWSRHSKKRP